MSTSLSFSRMDETRRKIQRLLERASGGDAAAIDQLFPLVYEDLRRIAKHRLRSERGDHTLSTTALVHEAYIDLAEGGDWRDRAHFLAVASRAMRHILIDYARRRNAQKRGGGRARITLEAELLPVEDRTDELLALNQALTRLGERDPRLERVVECRFFGGMTVEDTAAALDVSRRTVERDWTRARAYLYQALAT